MSRSAVGASVLIVGSCVWLWPIQAAAIRNGLTAEPCAFPTVVRLFSTRSNLSCSASYIGGRVVITAAHCFDDRGYQLNRDLIGQRTNAVPPICETDADCPSLSFSGELRPLTCRDDDWSGPSIEPGTCYLDDFEYSNDNIEAFFGELYEPSGAEHPQVLIPIRYCHINPEYVANPGDIHDFAYCILAEEPDIQPVPLLMQCEVERYLNDEHDLDVVIAGFGVPDGQGHPGRKRWAWSSTDGAVMLSDDTSFSTALFAPFVPGGAMEGDSGGPLMVRLPGPNEGWRVVGVFVKPLLLAPAWNFVEWMLEDPEVEAEWILPCHDAQGNWSPGPACGGFPQLQWMGQGSWLEGPHACHSDHVSEMSSACGPVFRNPSPDTQPPPGPVVAVAPAIPAGAPPSRGCAAVDAPPTGLAIVLLALAGLLRPRRRAAGLLSCALAVSLAGCSDSVGSSGSVGSETGGAETGGVDPPEPLVFNPNFRGVHSGIAIQDAQYDQLAVGNVSRAIDDASCCQDIVLGGPASTNVEVRFGGGSTERGLTFLEPRAPMAIKMAPNGQGIRDLALADLDADGYNDLLVISSGGSLGVRLGQPGGVDQQYFGALQSYVFGSAANDPRALAVGQLDCDADLDVAIALGDGGVALLLQTDAGMFGKASVVDNIAAEGYEQAGHARDVAIGDFDGSAPREIVTGNDDGTVTLFQAPACGAGWAALGAMVFQGSVGPDCDFEENYFCVPNTDGVQVLTDDVFCGTPYSDLTVGAYDLVRTRCNQQGVGALVESSTWDIEWDLNRDGKPGIASLREVAWWPDPPALYAIEGTKLFRLAAPGTLYLDTDIPTLTRLRGATTANEMVLSHHVGGDAFWWQRLTWIGRGETTSELGFLR